MGAQGSFVSHEWQRFPVLPRHQFAMLRQAISMSRQVVSKRSAVERPLARTFGSIVPRQQQKWEPFERFEQHPRFAPKVQQPRPFPGASRSEPDMPYIEEPSMAYMTMLFAVPFAFQMWFLTKFV